MSSNSVLRELHYARLARGGLPSTSAAGASAAEASPPQASAAEASAEAAPSETFECAVCYTDGSASGLVIPKCCSHKICLGCYTNIVLRSRATDARCPQCRTVFLPKGTVVTDSHDDDYSDMPPLLSYDELYPPSIAQQAHSELEATRNLLRTLIYITASRDFQVLADIYPVAPNPLPVPDAEADVPDVEADMPELDAEAEAPDDDSANI